jgi:hypothetical protein
VSIEVQKFQGGGGAMAKAGLIGVVGLLLTVAGLFVDRRPALFSYLVAFSYWAGIALAALILLMIFHAFRAKWPVVVRRPLEAMATTVWLFLPLALPVLLGMEQLYSWVNPGPELTAHEEHLLHMKAPYLNVPFFIARTVFYFLLAGFMASRLFRLSTRQDSSGDPALTQKARTLGTGGLPFIAIVISFASFDWLMSLNPLWFSTIFGVYYFAGSFWSSLAVLIIVVAVARGKDLFGQYVSVEVLHNIGKLLFAFTCFWGYIAFSQMMLIWIANLPEEVPFFVVRMKGDWAPVGIALILGHFVAPFALLLSRDLKRSPRRLSLVAAWALLMNLVDIYWLVWPTFSPETPTFHWTLVTAIAGLGGLAIAFAIWRIRGHYTVPVRDPFLAVSLHYRQPT